MTFFSWEEILLAVAVVLAVSIAFYLWKRRTHVQAGEQTGTAPPTRAGDELLGDGDAAPEDHTGTAAKDDAGAAIEADADVLMEDADVLMEDEAGAFLEEAPEPDPPPPPSRDEFEDLDEIAFPVPAGGSGAVGARMDDAVAESPPDGVARDYPDEPDRTAEADRQDRIVEVFYGTDRQRNQAAEGPEDFYTGGRGDLDLGICRVNIPPNHTPGELEAPKWWRLELRWKPERHVMVLEILRREEDAWVEALSQRVEQSAERSAFVFVHGYNVSFNDAARRAGQIAYDLRHLGFTGAPILYSWPSQGGLAGYTVDENNVGRTVRHLTRFLELVTQRSGAEVIHLIAHSMGNRAVTAALQRLAASATGGPVFHQIALVAPDLDAEVFKEDIVPAIRHVGRRLTLYASAHDKALEASKKLHGYPRAGDLEHGVVIAPGLDTIDASDVETDFLAHSYFADSKTVISDIVSLLRDGKAPEERQGLLAMLHDDGPYWKIAAHGTPNPPVP